MQLNYEPAPKSTYEHISYPIGGKKYNACLVTKTDANTRIRENEQYLLGYITNILPGIVGGVVHGRYAVCQENQERRPEYLRAFE